MNWPKDPREDCGVSMWEFFMLLCILALLLAPLAMRWVLKA